MRGEARRGRGSEKDANVPDRGSQTGGTGNLKVCGNEVRLAN